MLILVYRAVVATDRKNTYACYQYPGLEAGPNGGLDWTTGNANEGEDGLGGVPAQVGFDAANTPQSFGTSSLDGQFCYLISGEEIIPVGDPKIDTPATGQYINAEQVHNVPIRLVNWDPFQEVTISLQSENSTSSQVLGPFTPDEEGTIELEHDLSFLPDGPFIVTANQTDGTSVFTMPILDTSTAVSILAPENGTFVNFGQPSTIEVNGSGEPNGTITLTISDISPHTPDITVNISVSSESEWSTPVDIGTLSDGPITITAVITDMAGNTASDNQTIIKDTDNFVEITSHTNGQFINAAQSDNMTIVGTGFPASTVYVTLSESNGTNYILTPSTIVLEDGTWSIPTNASSLLDGQVIMIASSEDLALNSVNSTSVTLNKDTITNVAITTH